MPVAEAKQRISFREFRQWVAFGRREPFDGHRLDANIAHLISHLAAMLVGKSVTAESCLIRFGAGEGQTAEQMEAGLRAALGMTEESAGT